MMKNRFAAILAALFLFSICAPDCALAAQSAPTSSQSVQSAPASSQSAQAETSSGSFSEPDSDPADSASGSVSASASASAEPAPSASGEDFGAERSMAEPEPLKDIGQVTVSIGAALKLQHPVTFALTLSDGALQVRTDSITLGENHADAPQISFENLPEGEYTLTVNAPGFAVYTQSITVESQAYTVKLMTGFLGGMTYEQNGLHPGVLLLGDVNSDGGIDSADEKALLDAVDQNRVSGEVDLNGDGAVNLVDLEYFAKGYQVTEDTLAKIEESVPAAAIQTQPQEGTRVAAGSLEELLKGEGAVQLTPANDAPISEENPVALDFDFSRAGEAAQTDGILIETGDGNAIRTATMDITYAEAGQEAVTITVPVSDGEAFLLESEVRATAENGGIQVHLGGQVAVKKVTLTITGMKNNNNLAEISHVEFARGMEERIPEPAMDIPANLSAAARSKEFTLTWDKCVNVIGYEVEIEAEGKEEIIQVAKNYLEVTSFLGKELKNYTDYTVKVQSINGSWHSGYCEAVTVTPKPSARPDKPDNLTAEGKYRSIAVSWKQMKDTLSYNLYYRAGARGSYQSVKGLTANSYTLTELLDRTEYTIYVTGVNEFGESDPSLTCLAKTTDLNPAEMPRYGLINRDESGTPGRAHLRGAVRVGGMMEGSALDTDAVTAWGTVDNNAASYYAKSTWDDGGYNTLGNCGLTYTFDQAYALDTIALLPTDGMNYSYAKVRWWDEAGKDTTVSAALQSKSDSEGRPYYLLRLPETVTTERIQIGLARYLATAPYQLVTVAEVYFYHADPLMAEVMGLYVDDLHTVLRDDVTREGIAELRARVSEPDQFGNRNPNEPVLLAELDTAETLLNDGNVNLPVEIHSGITTKEPNRGFGGLNAWQPLGVNAAAGETVMLYVGHNSRHTGEGTNLQLVATQYHAESSPMYQVVTTLKVGANEVTIPKIWKTGGFESGGALYVQYTGSSSTDRYAVRVSGGTPVPILDLYRVSDPQERLSRTQTYVRELEQYVEAIPELHSQNHEGSDNANVDLAYEERNCILGASDILLDTMMLSLPAQQILSGAGSGTSEERATAILRSMDAMEDMMDLFYQHKGLNALAPNAVDQIPSGHLNIRYQRMFSGAFMYASGNHIGIEWPETAGMMGALPVACDAQGHYVSGHYFGWGIGHEIGHCINQGAYAVAEITNNYFAQLAQAKDTNEGMRFDYENIYKKVTSGAKGDSSNLATQLGMYWQLHLAYDKGYNYQTYTEYDQQLANLFYARVDTYARTPSSAPAPAGTALTLSGERDQDLMRLACAAAEKNILAFFERWGKTPNADTRDYAAQFEEEQRAIYYVSDDSRVYALKGDGSTLSADGSTEAVGEVTVSVNEQTPNQVDFQLSSTGIPEEDVLGYEIVRCTYSGGQIQRDVVGFATGDTFSDVISTMNNRTVFYEITLVDQYLNRSAVKRLPPVKISHDGSMDKTGWTVTTTELSAEADVTDASADTMSCEQTKEDPANRAIDQDTSTNYTPEVTGERAELTIQFNRTLVVTGLKYTAGGGTPIGDYTVEVFTDGSWTAAAEGHFGKSDTVYFANSEAAYISTYEASAVRLTINGQSGKKISIAEIDVLGVTGDNVDFRTTEDTEEAVIGTLREDYHYGQGADEVIPAGSVVFTGTYKGNPAYNVVLLYDQNGEIVGGTDEAGALRAQQIILADVPKTGNIQDVTDGTWIYWIEPEQIGSMTFPTQVRAELYRVNNALTNEGQRLVSDSLLADVPAVLPELTLTGSGS